MAARPSAFDSIYLDNLPLVNEGGALSYNGTVLGVGGGSSTLNSGIVENVYATSVFNFSGSSSTPHIFGEVPTGYLFLPNTCEVVQTTTGTYTGPMPTFCFGNSGSFGNIYSGFSYEGSSFGGRSIYDIPANGVTGLLGAKIISPSSTKIISGFCLIRGSLVKYV